MFATKSLLQRLTIWYVYPGVGGKCDMILEVPDI